MKSGHLLVLVLLAAIAGGIYFFATKPSPQIALSSNPNVNRNATHVLPGRTYDQRRKIDPGMTQADLIAALGQPSEKSESRGNEVFARWNYLYADGYISVRIRDRRVTDVDMTIY